MNLKLDGQLRLLGIIGAPVSQTRTPALANKAIQEMGHEGRILVPMHVPSGQLTDFTSGLRAWQNFDGAVVTMPHKKAMAQLVDDLSPTARLVGAVNVIRRTPDGRLLGKLLDGEGFVKGLLREGLVVQGARCLLRGAGGAASAIAYALATHGCRSICIINRSEHKALALAETLAKVCPDTALSTRDDLSQTYDLAINASSLGMQPADPLPFSLHQLSRSSTVAECVIAPEMTPLLMQVREAGGRYHTGIPMLEEQLGLMLAFMGVRQERP